MYIRDQTAHTSLKYWTVDQTHSILGHSADQIPDCSDINKTMDSAGEAADCSDINETMMMHPPGWLSGERVGLMTWWL